MSPQALRIAIIGAGPAGFYAAEHLLKKEDLDISVDLFDRLPTPHGLVRAGVAPDHEKIKNVTRKFERTADRPGFRFFGNVDIGINLTLDDLKKHYHQVLFTTGAQVDRRLGIPGEDLERSYSATEFVAWYNGHPDYSKRQFDLSGDSVVVIGVGNVAVDVARILCRTTDELKRTDIADYAIEALAASQVKEIHMLGRRGPAQAAFTNPEIKELRELVDADLIISEEDATVDEITAAYLVDNSDRMTTKKLEILAAAAKTKATGKTKRLFIHFLTSPTELVGDDSGVESVATVRNELYLDDTGRIRPKPTSRTGSIPAHCVFRSVGYRGVSIPNVPFREDWGTIPHSKGRILSKADGDQVLGLYAAGWIKRGPSGVIGTNKADAIETAESMIEDASAGDSLAPTQLSDNAVPEMLSQRNIDAFSWSDWSKVDSRETERGLPLGRPRLKYTSYKDLKEAKR